MLEPPYHRVLDRPVLGDDGLLTDDSRTMLEERGWDGIGRNPPKDDLLNETTADRRERLARAKVRKVRGPAPLSSRSCQPLPDPAAGCGADEPAALGGRPQSERRPETLGQRRVRVEFLRVP